MQGGGERERTDGTIMRIRPELAWLGTESNQFGTDEFMKWCEAVGTEPYLCLNFGTGAYCLLFSEMVSLGEKLNSTCRNSG